jgi:membrane associated rhomboid family serine protease
MGIYDRDYIRRRGPGYLDAWASQGSACATLIAINVVVFILQFVFVTHPIHSVGWSGSLRAVSIVQNWFALDPAKVMQGEIWRLLSYAFLHDTSTWTHITFNMLFLWWFGREVEVIYGKREFLLIYLTAAVLGGIAFTVWSVASNREALCVGASGAVTAVMVLCAFHFPSRIIYVFMILPVPIWLFVGFQVCQDVFAFFGGIQNGTAVTVHLAGAAFAFGYYKLHWNISSIGASLRPWRSGTYRRPTLRVVHGGDDLAEPVGVVAPPGGTLDEQLEAKLDAVLEKVARHGQASLNENEREILLRASEIYKRRRS